MSLRYKTLVWPDKGNQFFRMWMFVTTNLALRKTEVFGLRCVHVGVNDVYCGSLVLLSVVMSVA